VTDLTEALFAGNLTPEELANQIEASAAAELKKQ